MKRLTFGVLVLSLFVGHVAGADQTFLVQPQPESACTVAEERNAALYYSQAMLFAKGEGVYKRLAETGGNLRTKPSSSLAQQEKAPYLRLLHCGTLMPMCSFGATVVMAQIGPDGSLPFLADGPDLARLACVRADWRFRHDRHRDALTDLVDVMIFGRDDADHGCFIQFMVGATIQSVAKSTLAMHLPRCDVNLRSTLARTLRHERLALPSLAVAHRVEMAQARQLYLAMESDPKLALRNPIMLAKKMNNRDEPEEQMLAHLRSECAMTSTEREAALTEMESLWTDWEKIAAVPYELFQQARPQLEERNAAFRKKFFVLGDSVSVIEAAINSDRRIRTKMRLLTDVVELPDVMQCKTWQDRMTLMGPLQVIINSPTQVTLAVAGKTPDKPSILLTIGGWPEAGQLPPPEPTDAETPVAAPKF